MKKTPAQLIADALDAAMKTANNGKPMTQASLSRLSGVPQPTISRTLSGKSIPEIQTLAPLVSVLGVGNVDLASSIEALLPAMENHQPALSLLTIQMFAIGCKSCGKVTHKSLMELDMSDTTKCTCGATINITDYYREPQLQVILKSLGGSGFALRKRHK